MAHLRRRLSVAEGIGETHLVCRKRLCTRWQRIREERSKEEPLPLIHSGTRVADPDSTMLGIVVEAPGASTVCYGQTIAGAELLLLF
jgi:hypothetical protein